jgi:hypothetical protein
MFKDIRDWLRVLQLLKVAKVHFSISRKSQKIGIGRVINGKILLKRLDDSPRCRSDRVATHKLIPRVVPENEVESYTAASAVSALPRIEIWLRVLSLLVIIAVGVVTFIFIVCKMQR